MPLYVSPALLAPASAGMAAAPTIVGSGTSFFSSSGLTGYTVAHTVPAEANCLAVALGACKAEGAYNLTGVRWNGTPLAALREAVGWTFSRGGAAFWVGAIANPTSGAHDIAIGLDAAPNNLALYALNLAGVDTGSGAAAMAAASGAAGAFFANAASLSASLAPATPSLIFGGMALAQPPGAASYTPGSGVTELVEGTASGPAAARHFFGYRRETIAGASDFAATCTQSSACALAAVAFKGS